MSTSSLFVVGILACHPILSLIVIFLVLCAAWSVLCEIAEDIGKKDRPTKIYQSHHTDEWRK